MRVRRDRRYGDGADAVIAALLATAWILAAPATLTVSVGGRAEDPAYLPVYAAEALGLFEAEGVQPSLRRASHPTAAIGALRDREVTLAVTTADQVVRGAWARGTRARILVTHTRAPATALLIPASRRGEPPRLETLRSERVGIPGPGTTGHRLLATLLASRRLDPTQVSLLSYGGSDLIARLASGDLAAAMVPEPWASHALAVGAATVWLDLRRPDVLERHLGGPFYEVVTTGTQERLDTADDQPALAAFARAVIRVQAWLVSAPAAAVADRLPARLIGDRTAFVTRLETSREAYAPRGAATDAGLATTLRILKAGTPWPARLGLGPDELRPPAFVESARAALGPAPPPP